MKDIDFDELDQAVGSVLGTTTQPKDEETTPAAQATDSNSDSQLPVASPVATTPVDDTPQSAIIPDEPKVEISAPATSVAPARRRGQFLDMVHPSADMTHRPGSVTPVSRKVVSPVSTGVAPEVTDASEKALSLDAENNDIEAETSSTSMSGFNTPSEQNDTPWPGANESNDTNDNFQPEAVVAPDDSSSNSPEAVSPVSEPTPIETYEPAQTPFVTDAQVEKRPLGAFTLPEEEAAVETSPRDDDTEELAEETPAMQSKTFGSFPFTPEPLPSEDTPASPAVASPELKDEVVSVETNSQAAETETPVAEAVPVALSPQPALDMAAPLPATAPSENPGPLPFAAAINQAPIVQSIPQQYPAAPEKQNEAAHPLFDADEYRQPLLPSHTKKKSKTWLWLLIVLVLVIVGGVLGYMAFITGF